MALQQPLYKLARLWILREKNIEREQNNCEMERMFREEPHKGHVTGTQENCWFKKPGFRAIT